MEELREQLRRELDKRALGQYVSLRIQQDTNYGYEIRMRFRHCKGEAWVNAYFTDREFYGRNTDDIVGRLVDQALRELATVDIEGADGLVSTQAA